jgi:hypothetical protein
VKRIATVCVTLITCGVLALAAQQPPQPAGRGQGRGGRGGPQAPARKRVLAWADTRNGIAQHESLGTRSR